MDQAKDSVMYSYPITELIGVVDNWNDPMTINNLELTWAAVVINGDLTILNNELKISIMANDCVIVKKY